MTPPSATVSTCLSIKNINDFLLTIFPKLTTRTRILSFYIYIYICILVRAQTLALTSICMYESSISDS